MTIKLLTLDDAVKAVMDTIEKKRFGAHIFYYPDDDYFMVLRDSRNGRYADDKVNTDKKFYQGFIKNYEGDKKTGNGRLIHSVSDVVHELVTILEHEAHNFNMQSASMIYQDVAAKPIFDKQTEPADEVCS